MKLKKPQIIQQGAEAIIIKEGNYVIKDRIKKSYRIQEIDEKLRKTRTKREINLLEKASKIINSPKPLPDKNKFEIKMPYIKGKKLSEHLDKLPKELAKETCKKIGQSIAKLHDNNIIHGDLTTSNIILTVENKKSEVWFIDFGLGFNSMREEDKAVDLHLIKQALEAKHFSNWENYWKFIESGYKFYKNSDKVLDKLKKVESRGRYKEKY